MSTPQAGDLAPEVALPDEHGTIHRLGDRAGHWTVVYFYPADDTPGCTTEACQFRDLHGDLEGLDAEVWGISPDGSGSHAAFRAKFGLPFTLLSDEDHAVADRYGAWQEKQNYGRPTGGSSARATSSGRTDASRTRGRRSRPTGMPPRSSPPSKRPGPSPPDERESATPAPSFGARKEASPVGGDERSLSRDSNTTPLGRCWVTRRPDDASGVDSPTPLTGG